MLGTDGDADRAGGRARLRHAAHQHPPRHRRGRRRRPRLPRRGLDASATALGDVVLRDQIARADALYDEGIAGIRHLRRGRVAIRAAAVMYREILRQIERNGYAPGRATVSPPRKLRLAAGALR